MEYRPLDYFQRAEEAARAGDIDREIEILQGLVSLCQLNREPTDFYAEALRWIGNAYQNKNNITRAHNYRVEAFKIVQALGPGCNPYLMMCVTGDLGRSFIEVAEWVQAEQYSRRAVEAAAQISDPDSRKRGECIYKMNRSLALSNLNRTDEAIRLGEEVLTEAAGLSEPHYILAIQNSNLASMHLSDNRLNVSHKHARRALVFADFCHERAIKRRARRFLGDGLLKAWIATGNKEYGHDAERTLKQVVLESEEDGDFSAVADCELKLAQIATTEKREDAAARHCERAIDAIERNRAVIGFDEFSQAYFSHWEFTYERVARFQLRRQAVALAFLTSERSRNRLLLARLGTRQQDTASWNHVQRAELARILDTYGKEVLSTCCSEFTRGGRFTSTYGLRSVGQTTGDADPGPIREARESYNSLQNRQRLLGTRWSTPVMSRIAGSTDVQQCLGHEDAIVSFHVCDESIIEWAITKQEMHFQEIPCSRANLDAKVRDVCDTLALLEDCALTRLQDPVLSREWWSRSPGDPHPPEVEPLFRRLVHLMSELFAILFVPVLPVVDAKKNWIVVPHGPLHRIPWAALWTGQTYVIDLHNLALLPSASFAPSIAAQPLASTGEDILLLGAPDPPEHALGLPGAAAELEAVRKTLQSSAPANTGPSATKDIFRNRAPNARVIHVAAHHFFDGSAPGLSFLKLRGDSGSHFLYACEVVEMRLKAQLAVLSACETARSSVLTGDEQYGMVRSFLAAGVRSVISTLWAIEDKSAVSMFSQLYGAKVPLIEAVAAAQRAMKSQSPYDLPYFWTPYILSGEWNRPLAS